MGQIAANEALFERLNLTAEKMFKLEACRELCVMKGLLNHVQCEDGRIRAGTESCHIQLDGVLFHLFGVEPTDHILEHLVDVREGRQHVVDGTFGGSFSYGGIVLARALRPNDLG